MVEIPFENFYFSALWFCGGIPLRRRIKLGNVTDLLNTTLGSVQLNRRLPFNTCLNGIELRRRKSCPAFERSRERTRIRKARCTGDLCDPPTPGRHQCECVCLSTVVEQLAKVQTQLRKPTSKRSFAEVERFSYLREFRYVGKVPADGR